MNQFQQSTINYYNDKAHSFTNDTQHVEFTEIQQKFLSYLKKGDLILDLGCGSGRDSKKFIELGYRVIALDASIELCKIASEYTGLSVINTDFDDFETKEQFDGIWACASLLHADRKHLPSLIQKYIYLLKEGGVFYLSFKYGEHEGMRNDRYFNDLTEDLFKKCLTQVKCPEILDLNVTSDVRPGRENEKWLNCFLKRAPLKSNPNGA